MQDQSLKNFVEAALLATSSPLNIDALLKAALARPDSAETSKSDLREALKALTDEYADRGIELIEVASGFRVQVRAEMGSELVGLFEERPPRYSRAFFETLALIAYRQPITRGEIEDVRGVAVSSNIIRSMLEREWVRVVGHRDVPGKPAMFGTTKAFLDYFNLKKLDDLPSLAELTDIESLKIQLDLPTVEDGSSNPPAVVRDSMEQADSADAANDADGEAMDSEPADGEDADSQDAAENDEVEPDGAADTTTDAELANSEEPDEDGESLDEDDEVTEDADESDRAVG